MGILLSLLPCTWVVDQQSPSSSARAKTFARAQYDMISQSEVKEGKVCKDMQYDAGPQKVPVYNTGPHT